MNRQSVLILGLLTLVVAFSLAACSYYFVQPTLQPALSKPAPPPSPPSPSETVDKDLMTVSREMIMDAAKDKFVPRDVARNPFMWPDEQMSLLAGLNEQKQEQSRKEEEKAEKEPQETVPKHDLKVVMVGEAGKVALIDRRIVFEGDQLGENKVQSINPLEVVLLSPEKKQIKLSMAKGPRMVTFREPRIAGQKEPQQREQAGQSIKVPGEQSSSAEKMEYLLQEIKQMQGS